MADRRWAKSDGKASMPSLLDALEQVRRISEGAKSMALEAMGWAGQPVKSHVEAAHSVAAEALSVAETARDDIADQDTRLAAIERALATLQGGVALGE